MVTRDSTPTSDDFLLWVRAYRWAAVAAAVVLVCVTAGVLRASRDDAVAIAAERINPNTAPVGSLVRLPGIGKARALDIVHYRQMNAQFETVFESADDMQTIRGIGPKTAAKLAPWLTFEDSFTTKDTKDTKDMQNRDF